MAGGGQIGGMGASPMGNVAGNINEQPNMGGGMANSTNSTTTQDMMDRGGNTTPFNQIMGQLGLFGMGGQQGNYGGFGGGYNPMPQQMGNGYNGFGGGYNGFGGGYNNFGGGYGNFQQSRGLSPQYSNPQMQPQLQQLNQLNQLMQGRQMASGGITSLRRKR